MSLCALCKGTKLLCGKARCPVLVRYYTSLDKKRDIDKINLEGNSPPSVFVGSFGYPSVYIGPMIPPLRGDTSLLDTPEMWVGRSIDEIVDFRASLVRGKYQVDVFDASPSLKNKSPKAEKIIETTTFLSLAKNPAEVEAEFLKKPSGRIMFHSEVQPLGPSAPLKEMSIGNVKIEKPVEKAYYDSDLKATEGVLMLYDSGIQISKIQKAFSTGSLGIAKQRKFVPTRWSITAVDDIISKELLAEVKRSPAINEYRIYEFSNLDNLFIVLMLPTSWRYELIEAWYPNTVWNLQGENIAIFSSHEYYNGRSTYAEIGGCYYSARLASAEALRRENRQAGVVIMREAYPGYIMPVGVWNVRETVRKAFLTLPQKFSTLSEALNHASTKLKIPPKTWIEHSSLLKSELHQKTLYHFV